MRPFLLALVVLAGALVPSLAASAQVDNPVVEVCSDTVGLVPEGGPRACKSFDSGQVIFGDVCTTVGVPPEVCTQAFMQPAEDASLLREHEASWLARAHDLQRRLDDDEPLLNSLIVHTHNSNNATAYDATFTAADPNQIYSITDQLRMEIRGIELDLHWVPSPHGSPATGGRAVVLCHGTSEGVGPFTVHVGCSNDRPFTDGLLELRAWVKAHPGEFVLLYLENQMEDDPAAHEQAAAAIASHLGALVHRPASECAEPNWQLSQQELLDAGTPILIVGNCGAGGAWGSWVHVRGELWREGGNGAGYPPYPECIERRADPDYDTNFIRTWEDSTWVSAMVGGGSTITPEEARGMVDCGLDLIGLDRLVPLDARLEAMVWSWDVDEPADEPRTCAERQTSGRFRSQDCGAVRHFACHGDGGWFIPDATGSWFEGFDVCERSGGTYRTPPTGWENRLLEAAGGDVTPVWLNYQSLEGEWEAGAPRPADDGPGANDNQPGQAMPSTGGGLAALGLALLAAWQWGRGPGARPGRRPRTGPQRP